MSRSAPPPFSRPLGGVSLYHERPAAGELVPIEAIRPRPSQPRQQFDPAAQQELVASVRRHGVLQPVLVRPVADGYELVAGERRWRAAKEAGLTEIPAVAQAMTDQEAAAVAIVENLQREDLNPIEETTAILGLLALRLEVSPEGAQQALYRQHNAQRGRRGPGDQREAAVIDEVFKSLGKMTVASFTAHRLPLLALPEDIARAVWVGKLTPAAARTLSRVDDVARRADLIERIAEGELSAAQLRQVVTAAAAPAEKEQTTPPAAPLPPLPSPPATPPLSAQELAGEAQALQAILQAATRRLTPAWWAAQDGRRRRRLRRLIDELGR